MSFKKIIYFSLAVHLICAFFSVGFLHFDEHFQIVEFLNLKTGGIQGTHLPWEYREKIRPWFQVFGYWLMIKPLDIIGITNPFVVITYLRLMSSLFGWFATIQFYPLIDRWFKNEKVKLWAFAAFNFAWYVPYIHARTSSENISLSLFMLGMVWLLTKEKGKWMLMAGLAWGLSYQARFQMALPVAVLWIGLLATKQVNVKNLSLCAFGILVGIGSGFLFDYWGYGVWNFSLWHYYRTNFQEGIMEHVKHYPWYWYFYWSFTRGIPPVSLPLIVATLWGWWKKPLHALTLASLPLFLFHSMVGHKEVRYIFSTMVFAPFYLFMLYENYEAKMRPMLQRKWFVILSKLVVGINLIVLLLICFKPANVAIAFYSYVWGSDIKTMYVKDEDPFTMLGLPLNYYRPKNLETIIFHQDSEIPIGVMASDRFIFVRTGSDMVKLASMDNCQLLYSTYPKWLLKFNYSNWISRSRVWALFNCQM